MSCGAILLAAGNGKRLGFDKILTPLAGKPVIEYALNALLESSKVSRIVLVTRQDLLESIQSLVKKQNTSKPVDVIQGGIERQDSVWNGIQHLGETCDYILIHDGARPLLNVEMIENVLREAEQHGAAACSQQATDTIKRADVNAIVQKTLDRSSIWLMQTPQIFRRELITKAYRHVIENKISITDDASAVEAINYPIKLVQTEGCNLKITRKQDWKMIEFYLAQKKLFGLRAEFHSLCNQINPIIGYLPLLKKYGGTEEKFLEYLEKIKTSTSSVHELLSTMQQQIREMISDENTGNEK